MINQKYIILFFLSMIISSKTIASEENDIKNFIPQKSDYKFTIGVNFDPLYVAPGIRVGYKVNDYFGIQGIAQYTVTSNALNVMGETNSFPDDVKSQIGSYSYNNSFAAVLVSVYPFNNGVKFSAGIGYMDRLFTSNTTKRKITNANKIVALLNIGFEGLILAEQGWGYEINAGIKYMDVSLKNNFESLVKNNKFIPAINASLTYSF